MYRFIFIDLDDTLLDFGAAEAVALRGAYEDMGVPVMPELLDRYHQINLGVWEAYERGEISREALLVERHRQLFTEFGVPLDPEAVEAEYRRRLGIGHYFIPGAVELLDYLKGRGYHLYLASNGVADTQNSRLDSAGIRPYFEDIFISENTGFHKPEKEYFDYCFARIPGFDPSQALLIGDSLTSDVRGGKAAGIRTCWLNPLGKTAPPELWPDYEVRRLEELRELL